MSRITSACSVPHPHYLMYKAAELALVRAAEDEKLRELNLVNVYIMNAFTLEAYVNDICAVSLPKIVWELVERRLSTVEKIKLLEVHTDLTVDTSKEPFQLLKPLFQIRDKLAHCKRQVLQVAPSALEQQTLVLKKPDYDKYLNDIPFAEKMHKAVFDMVSILHESRREKDQDTHPLQSAPLSHFITVMMTKTVES